jgi:hypothetical protein
VPKATEHIAWYNLMSPNFILLILFVSLLLISVFFVLPRLLARLTNQKGTRDEAIKLGLFVEEVQEGAPTFSEDEHPIRPIKDEHIYRYSLKRIKDTPTHWSILPRLMMKDVQYPEHWIMSEGVRYPPEMWFLLVKDGNPSDCLIRFVRHLASEWTEEYLEFEGTPTEVRAYWHEWGGEQQAKVIYEYLTTLQQC